ncbi:MAG: transposase [Bacteroidales bacterium]
MTNLQPLSLFSKDSLLSNRYLMFLETPLGKLYQSIPFEELANLLPKKETKVGAPSWFEPSGFFGLMFLKHYTNLSDQKLIERLNTDWAMQFFCGMQLKIYEIIKDDGLVSRIRQYLAEHIEIEDVQRILIANWKEDMENTHALLSDATAYESHIKFPTDVKLLWDCVYWVYQAIFVICKELKIKRPRSRFVEQERKQLSYNKCRKKTHKITHTRKKALLYLLNKGLGQLKEILNDHKNEISLDEKQSIRLIYIKEVYRQQLYMFDNHTNTVINRIVSLFKPYIRPIVRGKENKKVEFGAKVNKSMVDGISLIDRLSFDAFNEALELKRSIRLHNQRFGRCKQVGVDAIYGTNANRKYMKAKKIFHSLVRKGRASKYEQQESILRSQLGKERSTVLEGSFGNEKNHYGLSKVKARTEPTEIVWILFGIMTANAVKISKRRAMREAPPGKAPVQLVIAA